jgi:hypothetical protein
MHMRVMFGVKGQPQPSSAACNVVNSCPGPTVHVTLADELQGGAVVGGGITEPLGNVGAGVGVTVGTTEPFGNVGAGVGVGGGVAGG